MKKIGIALLLAAAIPALAQNSKPFLGRWDLTVTVGDMKHLPVVVPPDDVLTRFNEYAGPWLDQMLANLKENRILARTRDYLLPKLLSGEV